MRLLPLLCLGLGCGQPASSELVPSVPLAQPGLTVSTWSTHTRSSGLVEVEIEVGEQHGSYLLSMQSPSRVGVERAVAPDGTEVLHWTDWWYGDESLTGAIEGWTNTAALNWPIRPEEGALQAGTWMIEVYTLDDRGDYARDDVDLALYLKPESDPDAAEVHVDIYYADGVKTPPIVNATKVAVAAWKEIWADEGLILVEHYQGEVEIDAQLGFVSSGSDEMAALAESKEAEHLVVLIGEGFGSGYYQGFFGVAGGIPGTLDASPWTWVTVSWLAHAGVDGTFNQTEKGWMGATMAHEVGHYVGLFHPVECGSDCGGSYDAITDTPRCDGWRDCEEAVGSNLMFPYAICGFYGCEDQTQLTPDQVHVAHQYTAIF